MWWSLIAAFFMGVNAAGDNAPMVILWTVVLLVNIENFKKADRISRG